MAGSRSHHSLRVWFPGMFLGLLVLVVASVSPTPHPFKSPDELKYYVQLELGGVDLAINFLPPLNTSFSANFGAGMLFAFNVTKGPSRTSKHLGFVRGFSIQSSYLATEMEGLEVAFIEYDDGHYNGTIQIQGKVQVSATEVAIVGGTGSFRGARGYIIVSLVQILDTFRVFSHEVHFM